MCVCVWCGVGGGGREGRGMVVRHLIAGDEQCKDQLYLFI